jgi:hypothetical protein
MQSRSQAPLLGPACPWPACPMHCSRTDTLCQCLLQCHTRCQRGQCGMDLPRAFAWLPPCSTAGRRHHRQDLAEEDGPTACDLHGRRPKLGDDRDAPSRFHDPQKHRGGSGQCRCPVCLLYHACLSTHCTLRIARTTQTAQHTRPLATHASATHNPKRIEAA